MIKLPNSAIKCGWRKLMVLIVVLAISGVVMADRTISENYTLTTDEDWTADGEVHIANGVTVDLAGHNLSVAGLVAGSYSTSALCVTNTEGVVAGYQDLEFIDTSVTFVNGASNSNGQRIITDFKPSATDIVEMKIKFLDGAGSGNNQFLWCDRIGGANATLSCGKVNGKFRFDRGSSTGGAASYSAVIGTEYSVVANYNTRKCTVNGNDAGTMSSNIDFTPPTNIVLFASFEISNGALANWNNHAGVRFYHFKVFDSTGTTLKCHIVPVYDEDNGVIGVYDRVAGKFYRNSGAGGFSAVRTDLFHEITNSAAGDPAELRIVVPGYQQLEYIQPEHSQYIITDYVPESTDRMEMKVVPIIGTASSDNQFFFCTRTRGGGPDQFGLCALPAKLRFDLGGRQSSNGISFSSGNEYTIVADGATGTVTVNGSAGASVTPPSPSFTAATNLVLFASFEIPNGSMTWWNNYSRCKCYYFKAYGSDGTLKLDLVPAMSSNSEYGMYDRVCGKFYASASATAFSAHGRATGPAAACENTSIVFSGNLKVLKEGNGSFTASKPGQTFTGGTVVAAGTLVCGTDGNDHPFGPEGGTITVSTNASGKGVLDMGGRLLYNDYLFELNGGVLKNSRQTYIDSYKSACVSNMVVTADSLIQADASYGFTSLNAQGNYGLTGSYIDLGGHKLTVNTPKPLYVRGLVTTEGTIELFGNRLIEFLPPESDLRNCTLIVQDNGQLRPNSTTPLLGNYIVNTTAADNNPSYHKNGCKVLGTFQPNTDYFCGCELQDGAELDISKRTTVFNLKGKVGDSLTVEANTVSFADNATIMVNLAGREDLRELSKSGSPYIVTWESEPQGVTFELDEDTRKYYHMRSDAIGLKLIFLEGMSIFVR